MRIFFKCYFIAVTAVLFPLTISAANLDQYSEAIGLKKYSKEEITELDITENDAFVYDLSKRFSGTVDLIENIEKAVGYGKSLSDANIKIDKLLSKQKTLDSLIDAGKHSLSYKNKVKAPFKEVLSLNKKLNDLHSYKETNMKLVSTVQKSIKKLPTTRKLHVGTLKGAGGELKKKLGVGTVFTVIDVSLDVMKKQERIKQGSTATLENLNIALKIVESFGPPSIPGFKTPSDVGRAIIDYQVALKQRNASWETGFMIAMDGADDFTSGGASIESFIIRKSKDKAFISRVSEVGVEAAYAEIRKEYMQHYTSFLESLYDTKQQLADEKSKYSLEVTKKMLQSQINGFDIAINQMLDKSNEIWQKDAGFDLIEAINELNLAKKEVYDSIARVEEEKAIYDKKVKRLIDEFIKIDKELHGIRNIAGNVSELRPEAKDKLADIDKVTDSKKDQYDFSNNNFMQNQLTAITQGGSSRIGTASYFIGRSPAQDKVEKPANLKVALHDQKFNVADLQGVRESSQYTNGQILAAPVDILLCWGGNPSDLDSHLTGPMADGSNTRFHTYYDSRGSLDSAPNVLLHSDYTNHSSGGANLPEQTRINTLNEGVYRFYVHDFSNKSSIDSTSLANSAAVVTFHNAGSTAIIEGQGIGKEVARITVPANGIGNTWQVFELDSRTGILNSTSQFRNINDSSEVPFNE